ncbi:PTS sugar transporter subunit IIA [candidate division WOR-3 bacterium]|nr:PTS sugar transporter subunit IIA [candidate division WOR-3 bacterium]
MLLQELIDEKLINCNLVSKDKFAVIEGLVELFVNKGIVTDKDKFLQVIKKREEIESTAIGSGIAIPHGRSDTAKELKVAFGKSEEGVDFKALDKKSVHLIFMIAAPIEARKEYLQAVAKVARFLKSKVLKEALLKAKSSEDVMRLVMDFDGVVPEKIEVETKEGRVIYKK